jgi:formylglycine-generating enzyme required for sulfatase activity
MDSILTNLEVYRTASNEQRTQCAEALVAKLGPGFGPLPPEGELGFLALQHHATATKFLVVPGGSFQMGMSDEDLEELSEYVPFRSYMTEHVERFQPMAQPLHQVTVAPFILAAKLLSPEDARGLLPQANVAIGNDGRLRFDAASVLLGAGPFRLPSEAEFEWVARQGGQLALINDCAEQFINSDDPESIEFANDFPETSSWGFEHLYVEQWVADEWHSNYDGAPADGSPWMDGEGQRTVRGGLRSHGPEECVEDLFFALAGYRRGSEGRFAYQMRLAISLP